ncbi:TPA: aminoacyl-tRNA hydrolase [Candidatus Saccharibacteria bacterium]|nr:aminoacyl-tRNA hydrolase [Candidatus Saccharibacteria bacterium]HIO87590.1 aminoacyl-tRNA hydrolase [Candidatus Saccharibacteria bacterium]
MKIIIGLGNVGRQYVNTRHNVGFKVIDALAFEMKAQYKDKFKLFCVMAKGELDGAEVVIAKPTTMMNESGKAARALMDFFKVAPEDLIVVHDELDIQFGDVKVKHGGRDGSHNGLASVTQHIGPEYRRVRVGIDQKQREIPVPADFVLANFNENEKQNLQKIIQESVSHIKELL